VDFMKIYISHAEKDRALVEELARRLTEAGLEPWNPYEEIFPGDNWDSAASPAPVLSCSQNRNYG